MQGNLQLAAQFHSMSLSGLFHKYGYVRGQGFFGQTRREQRSLAEKERPPGGLRRIWPGAALLGRSSIAGDTLSPSRLASGQIGRNERDRIYETDHLGPFTFWIAGGALSVPHLCVRRHGSTKNDSEE